MGWAAEARRHALLHSVEGAGKLARGPSACPRVLKLGGSGDALHVGVCPVAAVALHELSDVCFRGRQASEAISEPHLTNPLAWCVGRGAPKRVECMQQGLHVHRNTALVDPSFDEVACDAVVQHVPSERLQHRGTAPAVPLTCGFRVAYVAGRERFRTAYDARLRRIEKGKLLFRPLLLLGKARKL